MPAKLKAMMHTLTETVNSIKQDMSNIKHNTVIITTSTSAGLVSAPALQCTMSWAQAAVT